MKLRLITSYHWWYAHREELPDFYDVMLIVLAAVCLGIAWHEYGTYTLRKEAEWVSQIAPKFKLCMEGKTDLGVRTEKDGTRWLVKCEERLEKL